MRNENIAQPFRDVLNSISPEVQADARVAAAFELAAQRIEKVMEHSPKYERELLAGEIRKSTPPEATAALEKMLLEARREGMVDAHDADEHCEMGGHMMDCLCSKRALYKLDAQLAALTGEK